MRKSPGVIVAMLIAAVALWQVNARDTRIYCPGRGYLDAAGMVRMWRAAVMQQLTGLPQPPWCSGTGERKGCQWLRRWRGPAAAQEQVALVREAFRLLEECAQERGDFPRCRQLVRRDGADACKALSCTPYGRPARPWVFAHGRIRAIIFARDPEGMEVDFRIYADDAHGAPFLRPEAPGYARALAAKLRLYADSLTGNHCPAAKVILHGP